MMRQTPVDRAVRLHQRAQQLEDRFEFAEAVALYLEAAAIFKAEEGLPCPDLANVLNDLASALASSARYDEARQAAEKSVHILDSLGVRFGGPEAASIRITALGRWGAALRELGRYSDAEPVLRRAVDAATKEFGSGDDRTAAALNELGVLFKYSGKFDEAKKLYRRALKILEGNHGPDSPETASVWHNLGGLEHARGHFAAGEPAARKGWQIRSAHLGPNHPETLADEAALAGILDGLGRNQDSEPIYRRVIAAFERIYGPEHYEIAVNLNNLALVRDATGDPLEAEALYRRSMAIKEKLFGREHVEVALTALNFASFLLDHHRPKEAAPLAESADRICRRALTPDHPRSVAAKRLLRQLSRGRRDAASSVLDQTKT